MWRSGTGWSTSGWSRSSSAAPFAPTSAESTAFLTRATGITLDADKINYDNLISGLVADGVWAKLDALWMLIAPDSASQLMNLVSTSYTLTPFNYTFAARTPVTGNTTSRYFTTGFIPSGATKFLRSDASLGARHTNTRSAATGQVWASLGLTHLVADLRMIPSFNGAIGIFAINAGQLAPPSVGLPSLIALDRSGANATNLYVDGVVRGSTDATPSEPADTTEMYLFVENNSGTPANFTGDTIAMVFTGGSLGATHQLAMHNRVNTFLAAYGF